jgi:ABC-type branched-subunit amino acid transport system substrate-binding protein
MFKKCWSAAVLAALAAGLVACGDDNNDNGKANNNAGSTQAKQASGAPIKVFSVGPYTSGATAAFDEVRAAAEAAVKSINADGGVNGRKIELETCDSKLTPATEQACYQRAATDKSVAAAVGGYGIFPETWAKLIGSTGLPAIGGMGNGEPALTSPNVFVQLGGYPNSYYVAAQHAVQKGAKRVAFYSVDLPGTQLLTDAVTSATKAGGGTLVGNVQLSAAQASTAATSSKVVALKPDAVILAISPLQTLSGIAEMRRGGYDGPIYVQTSLTSAASLKAFGKFKNLVGFQETAPWSDTSVPGIAAFRESMSKYEPKAPLDEIAVSTWLAFQTLKQVGEKIDGDITRQSLMSQLNKASELDTQGLTPNVNGWYTGTPPSSTFPRLFNNYATITSVDGGKFDWDKTFYPGQGGGDSVPAT